MMRFTTALVTALIALASCTNQNIYEATQTNRKNECSKEAIPAVYERCMKDHSMTYDEYARTRVELLESE